MFFFISLTAATARAGGPTKVPAGLLSCLPDPIGLRKGAAMNYRGRRHAPA